MTAFPNGVCRDSVSFNHEGRGFLPLPVAIICMERADATEVSLSSKTAAPSPDTENAS